MNRYIKSVALLLATLIFSNTVFAQEKLNISDYVRQIFIHGIPYEQALQYDKRETVVLKAMLKDYQEHPHWANIIVMLEIIGDENVVADVVDFIEEDQSGEYAESHYRAKVAAIYGLGYVINHHNSKKALKYLQQSLSPAIWKTRGVVGIASYHNNYEERNEDMSKYAMLGLALAGTQTANNILKNLKMAKGQSQGLQRKVSSLIDGLILENEKIKDKGLSDYYKSRHQHE